MAQTLDELATGAPPMTDRHDRLAEIVVVMHGPAATHNMPCAVCRDRHAVLDLTIGIMQPCWQCQDRGYRVRFSWWRWMRGVDP